MKKQRVNIDLQNDVYKQIKILAAYKNISAKKLMELTICNYAKEKTRSKRIRSREKED